MAEKKESLDPRIGETDRRDWPPWRLLAWHLDRGTRPPGREKRPGEKWDNSEFAHEVGVSSRSVRNWLAGINPPLNGDGIEFALFGRDLNHQWDLRLELRLALTKWHRNLGALQSPKTSPPPEIQLPADAENNPELADATYFSYRDKPVPLMGAPELIRHLESRHGYPAFKLAGRAVPATALWTNVDRLIPPDKILGRLDRAGPSYLQKSPVLGPERYVDARTLIKAEFTKGPIKEEGIDYRMVDIDLTSDPPKIHGAFGWYYDNILTQYAIEWELRKALFGGDVRAIDALSRRGALPLREAAQFHRNPIIDGRGRCAAITVSTLLVFARRDLDFHCLIRRRSMTVGVSPGMLHVIPAGMFESRNLSDPWSVQMNVWRELLEEVYNETERQSTDVPELEDYIRGRVPISLLIEMMARGSAEFSVTGICCDLLNLRPEICTVLFVRDPEFIEARRMLVNWEYEPENFAGKVAIPWAAIDEVINTFGGSGGVVASGAVCLGLGREWIRQRHNM